MLSVDRVCLLRPIHTSNINVSILHIKTFIELQDVEVFINTYPKTPVEE